MKLRDRIVRKAKWTHLRGHIIFDSKIGRFKRGISEGFKSYTVLCYPEPVSMHTSLWNICQWSNCRISNDPDKPFDLAIYWAGGTIRTTDEVEQRLAASQEIINIQCRDVSKSMVSKVFSTIFGYSLSIEPGSYIGKCVKKSDQNGTHDGQVTYCPIKKKEAGCVYQKLINNKAGNGLFEDLRVPFFRGEIPMVYIKYRIEERRFQGENAFVEVVDAQEQFDEKEIQLIAAFCNEMMLEYGELDILRDRDDNRIYIVDANPTPYGPPSKLRRSDKKRAFERMSAAFHRSFLSQVV